MLQVDFARKMVQEVTDGHPERKRISVLSQLSKRQSLGGVTPASDSHEILKDIFLIEEDLVNTTQ